MNVSLDRVQDLLSLMVKAALNADDSTSLAFSLEAASIHAQIVADDWSYVFVNIDGAWALAVQDVEASGPRDGEGRVALGLPATSPFTLDELLRKDFDVDAGVARIRGSAATG